MYRMWVEVEVLLNGKHRPMLFVERGQRGVGSYLHTTGFSNREHAVAIANVTAKDLGIEQIA